MFAALSINAINLSKTFHYSCMVTSWHWHHYCVLVSRQR